MTKKVNSTPSMARAVSQQPANDNAPAIRPKVRQWALGQTHLTPLKKAFLMVGVNLVDERGECFLLNRYFQQYLNMSRRCVQNYLRAFEHERLIELTGASLKRNGTQVPLYRFAPDDEEISALRRRAKALRPSRAIMCALWSAPPCAGI